MNIKKLLTNWSYLRDMKTIEALEAIDYCNMKIVGRFGGEIQFDGTEPEFKTINNAIKRMQKRFIADVERKIKENYYFT